MFIWLGVLKETRPSSTEPELPSLSSLSSISNEGKDSLVNAGLRSDANECGSPYDVILSMLKYVAPIFSSICTAILFFWSIACINAFTWACSLTSCYISASSS